MQEKTIQYLSEKQEEFVSLLISTGTQRNVARVLVFLADATKATSRAIERGADLRQPEVSIALARMKKDGWVADRKVPSERKGRPNNEFRLAMPLSRILANLEEASRRNIDRQLGLVQQLRAFA